MAVSIFYNFEVIVQIDSTKLSTTFSNNRYLQAYLFTGVHN